MYGPKSSGSSPLLSATGTTHLTEEPDGRVQKRWAEHFDRGLDRHSSSTMKPSQVTPGTNLALK